MYLIQMALIEYKTAKGWFLSKKTVTQVDFFLRLHDGMSRQGVIKDNKGLQKRLL